MAVTWFNYALTMAKIPELGVSVNSWCLWPPNPPQNSSEGVFYVHSQTLLFSDIALGPKY